MPKFEELKNRFKLLLKDDLKTAIQEIQESLDYDSKFYDDLIMFYSQIVRLNRDNHIQVITYNDYNLGVNKIRNGILGIVNDLGEKDLKSIVKKSVLNEEESEIKEEILTFEMISYGEFKGENGEYKLTIAPTVLFSSRLVKAFPGVRGLKWFEGETAIKRLKLLLREPTRFNIANGYGLFSDPIWWFRGNGALPIDRFKVLSHGKCLLNYRELKITKVAAYN